MKCFKHLNNDAICIYYSCHQGLCYECRTPVGSVYACKDSCEERAKAIATIVDISIQANKSLHTGELKDDSLVMYKQNKISSACWLVLSGGLTFYFLNKCILSFSKQQTDGEYLWFSLISGAFLISAITSFNKWRTLYTQRKKLITMAKSL